MFCPKCGAANNDNSNFCQNCSQPLTVVRENLQNPAQAVPNTSSDKNWNFQPNQNSQPSRNFQPNQNTGYQGGYNQSGPVKPGMKPWKTILLVLTGLVVAFFLIAALAPDSPGAAGDTESSAETGPASEAAEESVAASEESPSEAPAESASTGEAAVSETAAPVETSSTSEASAQDAPSFAEFMGKDVFDWNMASDKEKSDMAFQCQAYWQFSGITGEAVDMKSEDLVKKISERMGEQGNVFGTACEVFGIDPTPWFEQAGN